MGGPKASGAGRYYLEQLSADTGFYLHGSTPIATAQSPFQHIELFESPLYGRTLRIDGCFMTSERDEFFYHEPLIHLPATAHPAPRRALIVGGGDGGAAEELLKHDTIEHVVLAELDPVVVDFARRHLSGIHRGAFDDPRLALRIGDGKAFIETTGERFDQITLDLTDPFGPAQTLYTAEFYGACRRALNPGGVLSLHIQSPITRPRALRRIVRSLETAFPIVRPYLVYVPLYGMLWGMAMASDGTDPLALTEAEVDARIAARGLTALQLYNGATHRGMLALPNFVREILAVPDAPIHEGEDVDEVPDPASLPGLTVQPAA